MIVRGGGFFPSPFSLRLSYRLTDLLDKLNSLNFFPYSQNIDMGA